MMNIESIKNIIEIGVVKENEPLSLHTSYKIGGNANFFVYPNGFEEISKLIKFFNQENYPYFVIGKGSNILVSDAGYCGAVIDISKTFNSIKIMKNEIVCGGGVLITKAVTVAADNSLSGMEELIGIPGTIGGGLVINAGCYGNTISTRLKGLEVIDRNGDKKVLSAKDLKFSYRKSSLKEFIVINAIFTLSLRDKSQIAYRMKKVLQARRKSQPLSLPSCGSVFKKPKDNFAGKLIEDASLKGYAVGGAMVSRKHANFIVNFHNAAANDVIKIINHIKDKVYQRFEVKLEEEVEYIGFK